MARFELTEEECDQVRKAIDIYLEEAILPNETILLDIYGGYAVGRVYDLLPASIPDSTYDSDIKAASIFMCAALMIPAIKQLQSERIAGHEKTFKVMDWDQKKLELEERASQIIGRIVATINEGDLTSNMPSFFTLAKANRADRW